VGKSDIEPLAGAVGGGDARIREARKFVGGGLLGDVALRRVVDAAHVEGAGGMGEVAHEIKGTAKRALRENSSIAGLNYQDALEYPRTKPKAMHNGVTGKGPFHSSRMQR
jgi:hypothetical protein